MNENEGWNVLTRALLHIWQMPERDSLAVGILDHCRRLILLEQYPDNEYIVGLVAESVARMEQQSTPKLELQL